MYEPQYNTRNVVIVYIKKFCTIGHSLDKAQQQQQNNEYVRNETMK